MSSGFDDARAALAWIDDEARAHETESWAANAVAKNCLGETRRVTADEVANFAARPGQDSLANLELTLARKYGVMDPLVLMAWPFARLPEAGWGDGSTRIRRLWRPENQPQGPLLYPQAAQVNLDAPGATWDRSGGARRRSIAVLSDPATAPATIEGTRAVVAAVVASEQVALHLRNAASAGTLRADTSRRFMAEADALEAHAAAHRAAVGGTLGWVGDFPQSDPAPPFATIPAQLRGSFIVSPI
jgi:hypothetical protein